MVALMRQDRWSQKQVVENQLINIILKKVHFRLPSSSALNLLQNRRGSRVWGVPVLIA